MKSFYLTLARGQDYYTGNVFEVYDKSGIVTSSIGGGDKISEYDGDLHEGYCTKDEKCWICEKCFNDFKEMFDWKVEK